MRVYVPSTVDALRRGVDTGEVRVLGAVAFAVTAPLRAEYPGWSDEELEYLAMRDAARASLRLLAGAGSAELPLRVVISADLPDEQAHPRSADERSAVGVDGRVSWRQVAAVHVDGAEANAAVALAAGVIDAADVGDDDAEFTVTQAEDFELAWYAPDEVRYFVEEL